MYERLTDYITILIYSQLTKLDIVLPVREDILEQGEDTLHF